MFPDLGATCQLIFIFVSLRSNVGVEMMAKFDAITVSKCNCKSSLCVTDGWGFPGGSAVKNPPANAGDMGLIPGLGRSPGEGNGNPLQLFLPGKSHGQRSLVGYSLWAICQI